MLSTPFAQAESLRRLVAFVPGTSIAVQQEIVAASGSTWLKHLRLVNAATIELPAAQAQAALDYLQSRPEVKQIHLDTQGSAQSGADTPGSYRN
jgi:hypothetical protein